MVRAVILSRPRDYGMAVLCRDRLAGQGFSPVILVDPSEWDAIPPGAETGSYAALGRMVGVDCAFGIGEALLRVSEGFDRVAKFDCDVRLSDAGAEWLRSGTDARCFSLAKDAEDGWGACWVAQRGHVEDALARLRTAVPCRCPESRLFMLAFKATGTLDIHPVQASVWIPGRPFPDTPCVTLPRKCPDIGRDACGRELFSLAFGIGG